MTVLAMGAGGWAGAGSKTTAGLETAARNTAEISLMQKGRCAGSFSSMVATRSSRADGSSG